MINDLAQYHLSSIKAYSIILSGIFVRTNVFLEKFFNKLCGSVELRKYSDGKKLIETFRGDSRPTWEDYFCKGNTLVRENEGSYYR